MSTPIKDTSTAIATVWRSTGKDQFGRASFLAPVSFNCCIDYNNGREYMSSKGIKFVPAMSIWFETEELSFLPKEGDFVVKGEHTAAFPLSIPGALVIKDVMVADCSILNEPDDVVIRC